ncbi:MAG: hypothetical protein AMDU4_FER2C00082G0001 [Ferroplasma sp. Type II]|nr:MAG: hypothetical protein AMDU4_FER2C00082G0001 [Ferroplasma sp. Type II]
MVSVTGDVTDPVSSIERYIGVVGVNDIAPLGLVVRAFPGELADAT